MTQSLSAFQARRLALAAQGFTGGARHGVSGWQGLKPHVARMQVLQIDSVNVLTRSHYLPLFSRAGSYDQDILDQRAFGSKRRAFFECWCHVASLVPLAMHPLMRWRMERARGGRGVYAGMDRFAKENKSYLDKIMDHVRRNGPTAVSECPDSGRREGGWWGWSKGKLALEALFDRGLLTTAARSGFERIYDLPERVIPASILNLPTPDEPETFRQLMERAAIAHGIGTEFDLRDYFRLPVYEAKCALKELVEDGRLNVVSVEGWKHPAYVHRNARLTQKAGGTALLSPFDPLVWERQRTERIFGFHYRIEIYTPAPKRKYGYYVLPFLMGDRILARTCLKADRSTGTLCINTAHIEQQADVRTVAEALAVELGRMAGWLKLPAVKVMAKSGLGRELKRAF